MRTRDPRVDAYIARSADFAKPILAYLRDVVHEGCPDVEETMKWSFPHFMHGGILCSMASFRKHCAFGFWKAPLIFEGEKTPVKDAMGHFGRIESLDQLPSRNELVGYVRKAARLNDEGVKSPVSRKAKPKGDLVIPAELTAALRKNTRAQTAFESLSPSHKREYVEWIAEAKRDETRQRRVAATLELLAEGKTRHWKYHRQPM